MDTPLKFDSYLKTVIWGGDKIAAYKNVDTDLEAIGESWEISAVPGHESVVAQGSEYAGLTIHDLTARFGADFIGREVMARYGDNFPLLIKIIDAHKDLSLQVHPDDELAMARHGSMGKTEMWFIIESEPDAKIYLGLAAALTPDEYEARVADNTIMQVVGAYDSAPGQFYYVPAGTLHAIGAGNLLAEVQQSSDVTYRVYDYDRRDANGNPRELHTKLAKDAIDYTYPTDIYPVAKAFDHTTAGVVKSDFFVTDYIDINESDKIVIDNRGLAFAVLMVTEGEMQVTLSDGRRIIYSKGDTVLMPASMAPCALTGHGKGLLVKA